MVFPPLVITQRDGAGVIPLGELDQPLPSGESLNYQAQRLSDCDMPFYGPRFVQLLLRIDQELATASHAAGCPCGSVLHRANYPRKPRGCLPADRDAFSSRLSFCCSHCRKRTTSMSARFLGRRVYVMLAVVLCSTRSIERMPAATPLAALLEVPRRTLRRWRQWWTERFPQTALWQASGARFMPPPERQQFPDSLLAAFTGPPDAALLRLLVFLSPLTTRCPVTLQPGR